MPPPPTSARVTKDNLTLQDFVASWLSLSRNRAKSLIDARTVFVNSTRIWMARHLLKRGDIVEIAGIPPPARRPQTPEILLETPDFLILNKQADCLANGPASAEQELRDFRNEPLIQAAHRLDRDTTGCLLMARNQAAFDAVLSCFRDRRVVKIYHALVAGSMEVTERCIDSPIDGESAVTHLRVLDRNRSASHLSLRIDTGRTHQIRRHLDQIGHPVLGDKQYGITALLAPGLRGVERQMLHAYSIRFTSPLDNQLVKAEAPLPRDFKAWMNRLRLD